MLYQELCSRGPCQRRHKLLSQCRGRGFKSHHLHQGPGQRAKSGFPIQADGAIERYFDLVEVVACRVDLSSGRRLYECTCM
jgi:hypothetical protein